MNKSAYNLAAAYAAVTTAKSLNDNPVGVVTKVIPAVLSILPGNSGIGPLTELANGFGMEVLVIRTPLIEYHPGALDTEISKPFEDAVATGKPVMVIFDEAHAAQSSVLEAAVKIVEKRIEAKTCVLIAMAIDGTEMATVNKVAIGLNINPYRILATPMRRPEED